MDDNWGTPILGNLQIEQFEENCTEYAEANFR